MTENKELAPRETSLNPYGAQEAGQIQQAHTPGNAMMSAEIQRSIAEVQASYMMAMQFPRNEKQAVDKMLIECQRPSLANVAVYSFPRGTQNVTGPSIRLAEAIKRNWGHLKSGWRCVERRPGASTILAYAFDYQTGVGEERVFEVRHVRDTKQGQKPLTNERDIYEMEANQAARRVRSCILNLIPGDIIDACLQQCNETINTNIDMSKENFEKVLNIFKKRGVTKKMIEARVGRNYETIEPAQMVALCNIYNSLKDGMSTPEDWFDMSLQEEKDRLEEKPDPKTLQDFKKENKEPEAKKEVKKEPEKKPGHPDPDCPACEGEGVILVKDKETGEEAKEPCICVSTTQEPPEQKEMI